MAAHRNGQARDTGLRRIRTLTNLAVVGAVTGTAAMGVFVAHEYGGHTSTATTTTPSGGSFSPQQISGDDGATQNQYPQNQYPQNQYSQNQTPQQQTQTTQPATNYAPSPSQGPPQGFSGGS